MHWGCFVWTPTPPLAGRRTPRLGPARVCVCLLFLAGSGRLASQAHSCAPHLFLWPLWHPAVLGRSVPCVFCFSLSAPPLSLAFPGFRHRVPWALAPCFAFFFPRASRLCVRSRFFFPASPSAAPWCLVTPPPLPLYLACLVAAAFFFLRAPPLSLAFSGFRRQVPWALALCFVCFVGLPLLGSPCALSFFSVPPDRLLLPGGCCPPPPLPLGAPFFFFSRLCASFSPAFSGFRPWVPWASALRVVCFVGLPLLGSLCVLAPFAPPVWPLAAPRWLLPPPPFCVSRSSSLPLSAVCRVLFCAVCPGLRCCAALLLVVSPGVVLLCGVLFCCTRLVPLLVVPCPLVLPVALGPCALRRSVLRCSPALCVFCRCVVVCAVVRRSALCCVFPRVLCCAVPVPSALCAAVP